MAVEIQRHTTNKQKYMHNWICKKESYTCIKNAILFFNFLTGHCNATYLFLWEEFR